MADDPAPIFRPGARIVLLDCEDRVLLFRNRVPGQETPDSWITPGGGIEPGESPEAAARRELWEETGLRDVEIGPCVWTRRHVWRWEDTWYDSDERFFLARVERHEVAPQALGEMERRSLLGHRWWSAAALAASAEVFIPRDLAALLPPLIAGELPREPLEVGE